MAAGCFVTKINQKKPYICSIKYFILNYYFFFVWYRIVLHVLMFKQQCYVKPFGIS